MKQYTPEELNKLSKEEIVALLMQSQKEAALFKERLEELQMHLFGRSTERMECLGQESIFNEAEVKYNEEENEPEIEKAVVVRSKRRAANWLRISRDSLCGKKCTNCLKMNFSKSLAKRAGNGCRTK